MEAYQEEREIDLKQLFLTVLSKWRALILFAAIGAILGAAYQTISNLRSMSVASTPSGQDATVLSGEEMGGSLKTEYASYMEELENYDKLKKYYQGRITQDSNVLEQETEYLANSIVVTLDPNRVVTSRASLVFEDSSNTGNRAGGQEILVVTEEKTTTVAGGGTYRLAGLYESALSGGVDFTALAEQYETEPLYLAELISYSISAGGGLDICVIGVDEEMSETILEAVLEQAQASRSDIQTTAGSHNLRILRGTTRTEVNRGLLENRLEEAEKVQHLRDRLAANKDALSKLEEPVVPAGFAVASVKDDTTEEETHVVTVSRDIDWRSIIKFTAIGCFGGLFLAAFAYALYYVLSGRVLSADEFNRRYRIKALTVLPDIKKSGVDAKIAALGNDKVYFNMSEEERFRVAASNYSVYAPDVKDVILVGSVAGETLEAIAGLLREKIADVRFTCAANINENAASLEALKAHEHVILVERALVSAYGEVDREMQQLADWGKHVIGSVILY